MFMKKAALIVALSLIGACHGFAGTPSLMADGDAAYAKRADPEQARVALAAYEKAIAADASNAEPCWKAARAAWWLGENAASRREKLEFFQKGIALARQGVQRNPDSVEAHFWLGTNQGSYGDSVGVMKSLFLVKPIRHEMTEVIRLDDRYLGGGGYRILGVVDYKAPGIAGGSKKRALAELEKALAIDGNNPFTHYCLTEFYVLTGSTEKARAEMQTLRTLHVPEDSVAELVLMQRKAEKLFETGK